jgi:gluconolactonase
MAEGIVKYTLSSPEGPVLLDEENLLVVEMGQDAGTVSRVHLPTGKVDRLVRTGRPNGLAMDSLKRIWIAESEVPSLLRYTLEGKPETLLKGCPTASGTIPFLFPNDFALDEKNNALFMTDSGISASEFCPNGAVREDYAAVSYFGRVFRISMDALTCSVIDDGLKFPNGIAIGPDGRLYVNETITGNIYRYTRSAGGDWGPRQLFSNVIHNDGLVYYRGPDGMKFSADGNLYCTVYGQGDVVVVDSTGGIKKVLPTMGKCPTNLIFVGKKIYVTEIQHGTLEVFDTGECGFCN